MSDYDPWENVTPPYSSAGKNVTRGPVGSFSKDLNVGDIAIYIPPEDKTIFFYFVISLYTVMVLSSLILNSFFAFVLAKGVQSYKKPFFRIVWQLVVANIISSLSNILTTFPPTFILSVNQSEDYHALIFYQIVDFLDNMADQVVMFMCLVIAAHRLFIFVFPLVCEMLFNGKPLNIILIGTWLVGFAVTFYQLFYNCSYIWKFTKNEEFQKGGKEGYFRFICPGIENDQLVVIIEKAFMVQVVLFPLICVVFYIVIYIYISSQRLNISININKTEKEILKQAAVLFTAFQISSIVSYASLSVSTKDAHAYLARRIVNTVELFAATLTPLLFFITSKELREGVGRTKPRWWYSLERNYRNNNRVHPVARAYSQDSLTTKSAVSTM